MGQSYIESICSEIDATIYIGRRNNSEFPSYIYILLSQKLAWMTELAGLKKWNSIKGPGRTRKKYPLSLL